MKRDQELKDRISEMIREPLAAEQCELADVVLSRYKSSVTLKLFVYSNEGVDLDRCARISRAVGDLIDSTDWFEHGYTLEVSSPGLDRPLTTEQDFRYRLGETVRVLFVDPKRKKLTAEIVSAENGEVRFADDSGTISIPVAEIKKATIVF